jgi:cell shape-determining protein MreC
MLSAQIDELREYAARADGTFPLLASALRGAADTIWQMRDDLQRTNAENARLKQELESVGTAAYLYGRTDLADENAKLRELVRDYHRYEHEDCYACRYINECRADESDRCIAPVRLGERYRELGVEVDE